MVRLVSRFMELSNSCGSVALALFFGFAIPTAIAHLWNDAFGGFIWGGLITKLASQSFVLSQSLFCPDPQLQYGIAHFLSTRKQSFLFEPFSSCLRAALQSGPLGRVAALLGRKHI